MSTDDILWLANNYYPKVYTILKRHMKTALVVPESAFGIATAQVVSNEFTKVVSSTKDDTSEDSARTFMEPGAARYWLLSNN